MRDEAFVNVLKWLLVLWLGATVFVTLSAVSFALAGAIVHIIAG